MTQRRTRINGLFLSLLMVLSMVAIGGTAAAGPAVDAPGDAASLDGVDAATTTADVSNDDQPDLDTHDGTDVEVDEEAIRQRLEEDGEVGLLLSLEQPTLGPTASEEEAVDTLQQAAERTQQPVLDRLATSDVATVENTFWIANYVSVTVEAGDGAIEQLRSLPGVEEIHINREVEAPEPLEADVGTADFGNDSYTYGLEQINAPDVWERFGTRGEGAKVAILDTGVDVNHSDIDLYTENESDPTYPGGWAEFDPEDGSIVDGSQPHDDSGHGTHTSGTATGSNESGTAIGVAPDATLIHGNVIPGGVGSAASVTAGIEWAVEQDADVASMSLGIQGYEPALIEPIENAREAGTVIVGSAGNEYAGTTSTPGNVGSANALNIGASNESLGIAAFSSGEFIDTEDAWGDAAPDYWPDQYVVPDVAAPGVDVYSSVPGGGYQALSGTSMSSPHIAGMLALMISAGGGADSENLVEAVEDSASKPEECLPHCDAPEGHDRDIRYGLGIVDAVSAVERYQVLNVPEYRVGDVTETGDVTFEDVTAAHRYAIGIADGDDLNVDLADANRDGEVTTEDVVLIHQRALGMADAGAVEITNFEPSDDDVEEGDVVEITADLENVGDLGARDVIEYRVADEEDPADGEPLAATATDLAPDETETISLQATITNVPGGDRYQGLASSDHDVWTDITVRNSFFDVSDLEIGGDADGGEIDQGDLLEVTAEVENTGNQEDTQDVEFRFDDLEQPELVEENVNLVPGYSETVTFELPVNYPAGAYDLGVFTDNDSVVDEGAITVLAPNFEVDVTDAPSAVEHGEEYQVDATITNTGEAPDEQTISYDLQTEIDVAFVHPEEEPEDASLLNYATDMKNVLDDEYLDTDNYNLTQVHPEEAIANAGDYDHFVVNNLVDNETAQAFFDSVHDYQGTVLLNINDGPVNDPGYRLSDAILRYDIVTGFADYEGGGTLPIDWPRTNESYINIQEDHPLFTGIGEEGDSVFMYDATPRNYAHSWGAFDNFVGDTLATHSVTPGDDDYVLGGAVGVDDQTNTVLLTTHGTDTVITDRYGTGIEGVGMDHTEESVQLLANAVEYVATGNVTAEEETVSDELAPEATEHDVFLPIGQSEDVTFEFTATEGHGVGEMIHRVTSEDGGDQLPVQVSSPQMVEVTDADIPDSVKQGHDLEVTATVEHTGSTSTNDVPVTLTFTELVEDENGHLQEGETFIEATQTLEGDDGDGIVQPGHVENVTFSERVDDDRWVGPYRVEVSTAFDSTFDDLDVEWATNARFDVTDFDADERVEQGETVTATATIENTGEIEGTQTVNYGFNQTAGEPDFGLADVAIVDTLQPEDLDDDPGYLAMNHFEQIEANISANLHDDSFRFHHVETEDLLDEMDHDVYVVNRVVDPDTLSAFTQQLEDDQAVVWIESWGSSNGARARSIQTLHEETGDPGEFGEVGSSFSGDDLYALVQSDHPIVGDLGTFGETVRIRQGSNYGTYFDEFDGETLAGVTDDPNVSDPRDDDISGDMVAVDDERNWVLLSASGYDYRVYDDPDSGSFAYDFTDAAHQLLANSVEYAAQEALLEEGDGIGDSDSSEEITLDGGESTTVTFEYDVPEDQTPDLYPHGVFTDDDQAGDHVSVVERDVDVEVTGYTVDPDPDETDLYAGDTVTFETLVRNAGSAAGEGTISLYESGEVVATENVTLDAGEVDTVDITYDLEEAGTYVFSYDRHDVPAIEIEALAHASIGGAVTDGDEPLEGSVELRQDGAVLETATLENGTYAFEDLDAGEYEVHTDVENYTDESATVTVEPGDDAEENFDLDAEADSTHLAVERASGATVTATSASASPLAA